jgi:hypothetical protein
MRNAWLVFLVACAHNTNSQDATCMDVQLPAFCVTGGLASLPFDATTEWTLTGTTTLPGHSTGDPFTSATAIVRDGTGCGHLSIFGYGPAGVNVDDTAATMLEKGTTSNGLQYSKRFTLCVDGTGALRYDYVDTTYTEGTDHLSVDGTLTH